MSYLQFVLVGADGVGKTSLALRIYGIDPIENLQRYITLNVSVFSGYPGEKATVIGREKKKRTLLFCPYDTVDLKEYDRYAINRTSKEQFFVSF